MKRFSITILLCVATLNAKPADGTNREPTFIKQDLEKAQYQENWHDRGANLTLSIFESAEQEKPRTIDKQDIPTRGFFPRGTEVYFPLENGSYQHGFYCAPYVQNEKIFWSTIVDDKGEHHSKRTRDLMVHRIFLAKNPKNRAFAVSANTVKSSGKLAQNK